MNDPSKLSDKTLQELKQIIADFPYFHAARMLYLKNLAVLNDIRLDVELKKMAIHIPDRMKLFLLLENEWYTRTSVKAKKDDKFSLIEDFLLSTGNDFATDELRYDMPLSLDYTYKLLEDGQSPDSEPGDRSYQGLIDSLAENRGAHAKKEPVTDENDVSDADDDFDTPNKISLSNEAYFTETLAQIYIRQKRYEKALEIISKLSLKYPEKNIYFADQIRFLEKLIIHTKRQ
jgi:predicted Zn-dependent protease